MANKIMYDRGDKELLPLRIFIGFVMLIVFLHMFFIKTGDASPIHTETLWKAVHPFHWFYDTVATLGFITFCLFLSGYLGKVFSFFTSIQKGTIQVIAAVAGLLMLLWFA
jgi:hypothetical protein